MRPIQIANFDPVRLRVGPVQLLREPVTGEPVRGGQPRHHDVLAHPGVVDPRPFDRVERDIRPVDRGLGVVKIKRRRIVQLVDDDGGVASRYAAVY